MGNISYYFDEMMARPVAQGLERKNISVVMAADNGMLEKPDPEHLQRATEQGMVLVTFDRAFATLTSERSDHASLICWTGALNDVGGIVRRLSEFADTHTAEAAAGHVFWLK